MPPYTSTSVLTKQLLGIVLNQQIVMEDSVQGRSSFMGHDVPSVIDTSLYVRDNTVHYFKYINDGKTRQQSEINIHELAHRCKEWAHKLGFMVQSYQYNTKARVDLLKSCDIDEIFIEETEPEAIFKACDYILKG